MSIKLFRTQQQTILKQVVKSNSREFGYFQESMQSPRGDSALQHRLGPFLLTQNIYTKRIGGLPVQSLPNGSFRRFCCSFKFKWFVSLMLPARKNTETVEDAII